ncbi:MDS1 and EVI1 complex locus protein EVI1-B-like [Melitaea cinxia]|uniref:MDS1 and EVI1 complex locus protein EVI1-B-like n=1 Tax=Melitaea cinxia TaxID=113334 RepID=UPI001E26F198|nr:MDS1 and EVI1 complex locus protein EVI1-B-like [Melitaea cinxia]
MEDAFKTSDWGERDINVNGGYISHLRFTDDIDNFTETLDELRQMQAGLNDSFRRDGLGMNLDKTKVMFNNRVIPRADVTALREHESHHTGEKLLTCKLCDSSFRTSGALSRHKRVVHNVVNRLLLLKHTESDIEDVEQ